MYDWSARVSDTEASQHDLLAAKDVDPMLETTRDDANAAMSRHDNIRN